jgi:hypothetical protein
VPNTFRDSPGKRIVRELWDTPLLEFLHHQYGFRYRYFGLPGVDMADLKLWSHMIDNVVAFEIDAPGRKDRSAINTLRTNLRRLRLPSVAYYGPFEFVVLQREDWDGVPYKQDHVVTLYNLDFCDEIASKVYTGAQGKKLLRFEALRRVLADQRESFERLKAPNWFVFMLTIRDQMDAAKLAGFLAEELLADTRSYNDACQLVAPLPTTGYVLGDRTWALKAFLHNLMRGYFKNPHVRAIFFPMVKYTGTPVRTKDGSIDSPMLHWIILCQFDDPEKASARSYPSNFLRDVCTLKADTTEIVLDQQAGESGLHKVTSSQDWFRRHAARFNP